jgi:dienelactone hydrolase
MTRTISARFLIARFLFSALAATCLLACSTSREKNARPAAETKAAVTEAIHEYREGDTVLEGYLAMPKNLRPGAPAVVIVHEWMGLGSYEKMRAKMLAELGYVAFAADIYGKGVRTTDMGEAGKLSSQYKKNLPLFRKRIAAAVDAASKVPGVDPKRVAIIGYCFGGTAALEAARAKMPVVAAVSFHGNLATAKPKETKNLAAKILVLHGADDPLVPPQEVKTFAQEMMAAKADWQFVAYGGAVHKFTNPEVPYVAGAPFGYNEVADRRSWDAMRTFFAETLGH